MLDLLVNRRDPHLTSCPIKWVHVNHPTVEKLTVGRHVVTRGSAITSNGGLRLVNKRLFVPDQRLVGFEVKCELQSGWHFGVCVGIVESGLSKARCK